MLEDFKKFMRCSSTIFSATNSPSSSSKPSDDALEEICSGRGECYNGTCMCKIQYIGEECKAFNVPYYAGISSIFYLVALVSFIQLIICIITEYQKLKHPSVLQSCRITTQKLLYFVVCLASTLRGAYFTKPVSLKNDILKLLNNIFLQLELQPKWAAMLMSAYYPLLMTCSSLVVCYWAEVSLILPIVYFASGKLPVQYMPETIKHWHKEVIFYFARWVLYQVHGYLSGFGFLQCLSTFELSLLIFIYCMRDMYIF